MKSRRGVTILEALVVMALLIALASVVVPVAVTSARASQLVEAGHQVEAVMMMARADAQREAAPVRVMARRLDSGAVALVCEVVAVGVESPAIGAAVTGASEPDPVRVGGASYTLPQGVSVSTSRPGAAFEASAAGSGQPGVTAAAGGAPDGGVDEGTLVAVFMPDGAAIRPGPRYLVDSRGRAAELVLEAWSGRMSVRPVAAALADERGASAEPEEQPR